MHVSFTMGFFSVLLHLYWDLNLLPVRSLIHCINLSSVIKLVTIKYKLTHLEWCQIV